MEYQFSTATGPLLLGELLLDAWEYRLITPLASPDEIGSPEFQAFHHPIVVVLSPPCDLESDHRSRFIEPPDNEVDLNPEIRDSIPSRTPYVRVCDVYEEAQIRDVIDPASQKKRFPAKIWERIRGNQGIRYHRLPEGVLGEETIGPLHIDFKKELGLPVEPLWKAIHSGHVKRLAVIPQTYVYDLFQRCSAFQSRIGQP